MIPDFARLAILLCRSTGYHWPVFEDPIHNTCWELRTWRYSVLVIFPDHKFWSFFNDVIFLTRRLLLFFNSNPQWLGAVTATDRFISSALGTSKGRLEVKERQPIYNSTKIKHRKKFKFQKYIQYIINTFTTAIVSGFVGNTIQISLNSCIPLKENLSW